MEGGEWLIEAVAGARKRGQIGVDPICPIDLYNLWVACWEATVAAATYLVLRSVPLSPK